mgnify:CR=1 FL=1
MARNEGTMINRSVRKLNRSLGAYTEKMMAEDWKDLEPKDRLELMLKVSNFIINNQELLKTEMQKDKENTVMINFFGSDDEEKKTG